MQEMNAVVDKIKNVLVTEIADCKVVATRNYSTLERKLPDGTIEQIDCSKANAVYYELEGGSFICIRPSGTEPKLKVYYSVKAETQELAFAKFQNLKTAFEEIIK